MEADFAVRVARPDDADIAADFAATKRAEYEEYSPVFWRRAADDREKHQPFLRQCIESDDYSAFAAERGDEIVGVILANRRGAPPPFHADREPTWFVDDFYVAEPGLWESVGRALLDAAAAEAGASGAERLIVVGAQRDLPKRSFLLTAQCALAAAWWVHPVEPTNAPPPDLSRIQAVVGPAPPVYDPGGLTALATSLGDTPATAVALFDQWAAASNAVVAIIPARVSDIALEEVLETQDYVVASEWFIRAS